MSSRRFPSEGWLISWSPDSTRIAVWITWGETIGVYGLRGERQVVLELPGGLIAPDSPVWSWGVAHRSWFLTAWRSR